MSWVMNRLLSHRTDWELSPGHSGGLCISMPVAGVGICTGMGSINARRANATPTTLIYGVTETGLSVSASLVASIYGSVADLPGDNIGQLWTRRRASSFDLADLVGHMMVLTVSKGNVGATTDLSVHFFGIPAMVARQVQQSGGGLGVAACMATARAAGVVWGITLRTEIQLGGFSLGHGYLAQTQPG
jgi:hypothetical protein